MERIVLDSYALIAFFLGEAGADEVTKILVDGNDGKVELHITSYNLGEVYYMVFRKSSKEKADMCWQAISDLHLFVTEPTIDLTFKAASLKATRKLSYADAHAAALALELNAVLITNDPEFDNLKNIKGFKVKSIRR
jgi:ribonuclease VapC